MDDQISRAAAVECAIDAVDDWDGGWNPSRETVIRKYFAEVPAVDAVPVVHGRWIHLDPRGCATISGKCSRCGWEAHYYEDDVADMPYCPNCGAKMDGERE